jgi:sphinganine-1-phosphate aldolase
MVKGNLKAMENKVSLNLKSRPREEVLKDLEAMHAKDCDWRAGKTFSLVYHAGDEQTEFLKKAYSTYFHQNGLNPGAFPSLKKYESEVVSTACHLLGGADHACGTMTSGGSESIMMAIKTYRDWARATKGITAPEMIIPTTAHPAFDKAAHYFQVKPIFIDVDQDFRVNVEKVKAAINPNTILLMGSAPQYPHGVLDPIEALAKLALENGIGLHVDACVGGFILPFLKKLGEDIPSFDFSVKGVTSISADLHKYGFAAKGASLILYHAKDLRRFQFFVSTEWPGGAFASPSMTGTRPAGSIAAAWATLQAYGEEGYLSVAKEIMENTRRIQVGVRELGFQVVGNPISSIFGFSHPTLDVYAIGDQMEKRGWHIDKQQKPNCLHLMVTPAHTGVIELFLSDLEDSVETVRTHPELSGQGAAALYGMMAHIPDRSQITGFLYQYMDERYSTQL